MARGKSTAGANTMGAGSAPAANTNTPAPQAGQQVQGGAGTQGTAPGPDGASSGSSPAPGVDGPDSGLDGTPVGGEPGDGEQDAAWNDIRARLNTQFQMTIPDDAGLQDLAAALMGGYQARSEAMRLKTAYEQIQAQRAQQPNNNDPAGRAPAAPAAPAAPRQAAAGFQLPKSNPQWDYMPRDDDGQLLDLTERAKENHYNRSMRQALPNVFQQLQSIPEMIEQAQAKAAEQARKEAEQVMSTRQVDDQFTAFMYNTPGLVVTNQDGSPMLMDNFGQLDPRGSARCTPVGDAVMDLVANFEAEGLNPSAAKRAAMRAFSTFQVRPQTPQFLRSGQQTPNQTVPMIPQRNPPANPNPARAAAPPPAAKITSPGPNASFVELCRYQAAKMGAPG